MFEHISLRPSDYEEVDTAIKTEMELARKGVGGRVAFAIVVGLSSLLWLHPLWAGAYVGAIVLWERFARPWSTARVVAALRERREWLRLYHRSIIFVIAGLYSAVPFTGLFSGQMVGWYVLMISFVSAVLSGITYFSNDKWQFTACIAPSFAIATAAPFVFGVAAPVALVVLLLNAMFTASALQSALHRAQLVESITKQQAARARAESANVEKSQFIANVSHELRSPLNAIIGYSELLREAAEEDARGADQADLDKVLGASRRLLQLVNELLDISKIEAGKLSLDVSWFNADEMIDAAVQAARPLAEASGSVVTVELAPDLGEGVGDEFRLSQCVLNLLTNALATPGEVTLRARRESEPGGEWFVIEVSDRSGGASEAALERLFDPFAADGAYEAGRANLGLAIARRIARLLGGDVSACSTAGAGVTFSLRVPAAVRGSEQPQGQREPAQRAA